MESSDGSPDNKRYHAFKEATRDRINEECIRRRSTTRSAQAVEEHLFETTGGDASTVTDQMIADAFDEIDKPDN